MVVEVLLITLVWLDQMVAVHSIAMLIQNGQAWPQSIQLHDQVIDASRPDSASARTARSPRGLSCWHISMHRSSAGEECSWRLFKGPYNPGAASGAGVYHLTGSMIRHAGRSSISPRSMASRMCFSPSLAKSSRDTPRAFSRGVRGDECMLY